MDLQKIKTLLDYVGRSKVAELTVTQDGTTVVIRNAPGGEAASAVPAARSVNSEATPAAASSGQTVLRSPVAGVVHQSSNPGAAPLVKTGDRVEAGQGLCVLEAMKVFTTVPSPVSGVIGRILFEDGADVEAGQPLVEITP